MPKTIKFEEGQILIKENHCPLEVLAVCGKVICVGLIPTREYNFKNKIEWFRKSYLIKDGWRIKFYAKENSKE